MPVRILIADDHAMMRDGLRMIIETHEDLLVVGHAVSGHDAIMKAEALHPDVILMDIAMPEMNGIEASRLICDRQPAVKILILSMHNTHEHVFRAIQAGAQGYLLKESAGSEVVVAIQSVMRGPHYFGNGVDLPQGFSTHDLTIHPKSPLESLSNREREVLQHVVEGKTSAEIAVILSLSSKSVDTYRSRLMIKLGTNNMAALVKFALLHGITPEA